MAFPTVAGRQVGEDASAQTSRTVSFDSAASAGQLLVVLVAADGDSTNTSFPGGWTELFDTANSGGAGAVSHLALGYLEASGGETSITVTTSASVQADWVAFRLDPSGAGAAWSITDTGPALGFTSTPDPPSHSPAAGAADYLWLAIAGWDSAGFGQTCSAAPASYSNLQTSITTLDGAGFATAERSLNAASENPGTFTLSASADAQAHTVAISSAVPPAITYVGASATPSGTTATTTTTTLALTYPAGILADDKIIVGVGVKPDTATVSTPAGYTAPANGEAAGGGGTTGIDTGPTRMAVFEKTADGTETGTLNITLANTPNVAWGMILVFRKADAGATWDLAAANGVDSTTGTPFTAAMGTDPGLDADDHVAIFGCIPTDVTTPAQFSSETLTATGITSTVTELGEPDSSSGNDIGGVVCRATINSGPSSSVPTFSATAGGTTTNVRGPIVILRLRSVAPAAAVPAALVMAPVHR